MTRMTAEVADGLLVHPFSSERFVRERVLPALDEGLAAAGRDRGSFSLVSNVIVATGRTDAELAVAEAGGGGAPALLRLTAPLPPLLVAEGRPGRRPAP